MTQTLHIVDQQGISALAEIRDGGNVVEILANVRLEGDTLVLAKVHVDGPGPRTLGIAWLRRAAGLAMELWDVPRIRIEGERRTTGAGKGRVPAPLVFVRADGALGRGGGPEQGPTDEDGA